MTLTSFRLRPAAGAGFHFGRQGLELEASLDSFPSDSLFAALVVTYTHLQGDPTGFLQPWVEGDPPWATSSVFPFVGEIPLLPMPRLRVSLKQTDDTGGRKGLKRLRYVSPRIFSALLSGTALDDQWSSGKPRVALQGGMVWLHEDDIPLLPGHMQGLEADTLRDERVWDTGTVPRVAIDRQTGQSNIFLAGRTVYAEDCGLWFAAEIQRDEALLRELLDVLGDSGIGGERSAGYGHFSVEDGFPGLALPSTRNQPRWVTLSRYHPRQEEIAGGVLRGNAAYDLVDVGGWMSGAGGPAQRRRRVRMVEAGSVLTHTRVAIPGGLVDVRPVYENGSSHPHPVYRSGFALMAGVTTAKDDAS